MRCPLSTGWPRARVLASTRSASSPRRRGRPITRASSPGARRIAYADAWELAAVERPLICCLDQVTDPRNLGAVVRSAAGAGATGVVVPAHGATVVTAVVCRASAGAVEHLPVAVVPNLARYLADVKGDRLWAYAAAADGDARLWDVDLTDGVALVLGAEGKGVRPLVRRTCDATISIPLATGVESLNVSVAAAVALFEARRQRTSIPRPLLEVERAGTVALPVRRLESLPRRRLLRPRRARRPALELRRRPGRARHRRVRRGRRGSLGRAASTSALHATPIRRSSGSPPSGAGTRQSSWSRLTPPCEARAGRRYASAARPRSSPSSRRSSIARRSRAGSATASTTRRGRGSSGSVAARTDGAALEVPR